MENRTSAQRASTKGTVVRLQAKEDGSNKQKASTKPSAADLLAKKIKIDVLKACRSALDGLNYKNDRSFAAAVQIAIAGANFSANELGRALGYDTGTIIKWYQGQMAPRRAVARQEVIEVIKVLVDRLLAEWGEARDSVDGIRRANLRSHSSYPSLRWKAAEVERA